MEHKGMLGNIGQSPMVFSKRCQRSRIYLFYLLGGCYARKKTFMRYVSWRYSTWGYGGGFLLVKGDNHPDENPMEKYSRNIHRCGILRGGKTYPVGEHSYEWATFHTVAMQITEAFFWWVWIFRNPKYSDVDMQGISLFLTKTTSLLTIVFMW